MKWKGFYLTKDQIVEQVERFCYVRDEERKPVGIVVLDKKGKIGWSLYDMDHEDEMATTDKGLLIALSRATTLEDTKRDIGTRIMKMATYRDPKSSRLLLVHLTILTFLSESKKEEARQ